MLARILIIVCAFVYVHATALALESNEMNYGDYTVYYNVFPSDALSPNIANATGIRRGNSQLVLTMVVKENQDGQQTESVRADIRGHVLNVYGQVRQIKPREIKDQGVIYYLYDFAAVDNERLKFSLDITPAGENESLSLEFSK